MPWMIVTDLDNTLVGDADAQQQLNERLTLARVQERVVLVYSTGRSLASYRQLCEIAPLLTPDVLITSVGTEIYESGSEQPSSQWSEQLKSQWDRNLIVETASKFRVLTPQTDTEQRPFKVSYFLEASAADQLTAELSKALAQAGLSTQLIYSGGKDLDILPEAANKGRAMQFIQDHIGIAPSETVACGDSGNDIALFLGGEEHGIIVGNAQPELLEWHAQTPSPNRYLAKAFYAAGILEGLHYFEVNL